MKGLLFVLAMVSLVAAGCGQSQTAKETAAANTETFMLKESDTLMAQPAEGAKAAAAEAVVAPSVVVNAEEGPLVEPAAASAPLALGDTPDDKMIQAALKSLGLYTGEVDGVIGPKTKEAITSFQSQNGLEADGKVGPKTWAALKKALEAPAAAAIQN